MKNKINSRKNGRNAAIPPATSVAGFLAAKSVKSNLRWLAEKWNVLLGEKCNVECQQRDGKWLRLRFDKRKDLFHDVVASPLRLTDKEEKR